jgi:hypothetical protein
MNFLELLMLFLVGWSILGVVGIAVSLLRGERAKGLRHLVWIAGVWAVYLAVLAGVSLRQKQRVLMIGQAQCFDEMCFTVTRVEEVPGFLIHDGSRLVRVSVRVSNRGSKQTQGEARIHAYLVDSQARRWEQSAGVSGVLLTTKVAPGSFIVSEPVFKVARDATGLGLVLTHGRWQPGVLVIGASDSLWHQRTVVALGR